jgi:CubicO group peptidase (beta-lactamase class C family)
VIEVVTGDPLSVALQRQIFGPLEMTSTSFQVLSKDVGRLTSAYVGRSQIEDSDGGVLSAPPTNLLRLGKLVKFDDDQTSFMLRNPLVEFGGAGLVSSTHDYLRFSQALREAVTGSGMGTLLLPPDIAQAMASNQLSVEAQRNSEMLGKELGFGFGVAIKLTPTKSAPVFPQCGFFWGGAASTNFWVDPASETSGVMMAQVVGGDVRSYWLAVLAEIHSDD